MENKTGRTLYDLISENKYALIGIAVIIIVYFWQKGYRPIPKSDGTGISIVKEQPIDSESIVANNLILNDSLERADKYFSKSNFVKDKNEAIRFLDSAIAFYPTAQYYYFRGKTKIEVKDFESAILDLNSSVKIDKNQPYVFDHLGLAKLELCRLSDNKGKCWDAIEDFKEAIRLFEEVKQDNTNVSLTYYKTALAYKEVKEYCIALDKCKLAVKSKKNKIYEDEVDRLKTLCK